MRLLFLLFLLISTPSWAYLTSGKVAVTQTSSSAGVPSTSQDSDISDTVGTSVSVGVPVGVTGNVNITGVYQVNGTPISATSNWNQIGSTINYTAGNVGIGSITPGQVLDVQGTVRSTNFSGSGVNVTGVLTFTTHNDVSGSRSVASVYQNTTGKTMFINIMLSSSSAIASCTGFIGATSSPAQQIGNSQPDMGVYQQGFSFMVPNNWYYEVIGSGCSTATWIEYS